MKFRFLISTIFAFLSMSLLMDERKQTELGSLVKLTAEIFNQDPSRQINGSERLLFAKRFYKKISGRYTQNEDGVFDESIEMVQCLPLAAIFRSEIQLDLDKISSNLVEHFNRTFYAAHLPAMNSSQIDVNKTFARKLKQFDTSIIEPLKSRNYYIVRDRFCLALPLFHLAKSILDGLFETSLYYVFKKDSYTFVPLFPWLDVKLVQVLNDENPNFDCSSNHTKFKCLSDCLKDQIRLSRYFFRGNETGIVLLDYENKTALRQQERICFERCKRNLCFMGDTAWPDKTNASRGSLLEINMMRLSPSIGTLSYWIQLVGLLLSFFGACVYGLASRSLQLLLHENSKKLLTFKILLVLLCLAACSVVGSKILDDFRAEEKAFVIKYLEKFLTSPEDLNLVVCVPVIHAMNHYNNNSTNLLSQQYKLKGLNFSELESKTDDAFNETVHEIYLETLDRRSEVSYRLLEKVLFMVDAGSLFSRCFQVAVSLNEPRYRSFMQASWLTIIMKHQLYSLYLLPEGQTFHSDTYRNDKGYRFYKKILTFPSKSPCMNYPMKQGRLKCDTHYNCLDQCAQEALIKQATNQTTSQMTNKTTSQITNQTTKQTIEKKRRTIAVWGVIQKELFSADQWSGYGPDFSEEGEEKHYQMETKCSGDLRMACDQIELDKAQLQDTVFDQKKSSNETVESVKISYSISSGRLHVPAVLSVIFDLLTVQGIFFDLNAHQLLITIALIFKAKFHLSKRNVFLLPIHLLCGAGFAFHIWVLFNQIQNDELADSKYYEQVNSKGIPEMLFCFDFDHSLIDPKMELTGNYLEEVTKHLTPETVFRTIQYLPSENEGQTFNESHSRKLRIETIYFAGRKCFSLKNSVQYELRQFYFDDLQDLNYRLVLSVAFNESFVRANTIVLFTKTEDKLYLSEPIYLNRLVDNVTYFVRQKVTELKNKDKFFFLRADSYRSLSSLFPERDVHSYLTNLKANFKQQHNATTTELPLTKEEFDFPINDTLFRRFYEQVQYPKDRQTPPNFVYEKQWFENFVQHRENWGNQGLVFFINFDEGKVEYRNENNLAKFILSNLNALSLWFGLNIFSPFALEFKLFSGESRTRILSLFSTNSKDAFRMKLSRRNSESLPNIWASIDENSDSLKEDRHPGARRDSF